VIPWNITSTVASLNPFNTIDKSSHSVSQLRAFHDFSKNSHTKTENENSMWSKKQNIKSKCPVVVTDNTLLQNEALLQITVPLGGVLHGVSLDDSITKTESSHSYGFPNSAQYSTGTCTVSSPNPDMVQYGTIPGVIDPTTVRTDSVPHCTILSPEIVPPTVPLTFLQGLKMPRRIDSHSKNKYTKIRKNSRTPLFVPRIIEHSKDADPHLDQSNPLTVITMDLENAPLAFPEPAPGVPKGTRTGVSSKTKLHMALSQFQHLNRTVPFPVRTHTLLGQV